MKLMLIPFLCLYCFLGSANLAPITDADCDDPNTFEVVGEVLKSFNDAKEDGNQFSLHRVTDAKIQHENDIQTHYFVTFETKENMCAVKSGIPWERCSFKTYQAAMGDCSAHILVNTVLKTKEVLSRNCSSDKGGHISREPVVEPTVIVALQKCLGCSLPIDTNSEELAPLVQAAIEKMNRQGNHPFHFDLENIVKAERQVVSGWNYNLMFDVRQTNCSKSIYPNFTSEECKLDINGQSGWCNADVFVAPTEQIKDLSVQCTTHTTEFCLTCPDHVESNDPELLNLLNQFITEYNSDHNHTNLYKISHVGIATRKLAANKKEYGASLSIQETNCSKPDHFILGDDCAIQPHGVQLSCSLRINVTNETVNILPDCRSVHLSLVESRITVKGFSPLRSVPINLERYTRSLEKSKGGGHGPNHKEEKHRKKEQKKDKGKQKHDNTEQSSEESNEEDSKKPDRKHPVPSRHPQYEIPKLPKTDGSILLTTIKQLVKDKLPIQPVTQSPKPFIPTSPIIPVVPDHEGTIPNVHEMVLLDLPQPSSTNIPKCPGKVWQPLQFVPQIPTQKPFIIGDFEFTVDDLAPPKTPDQLPSESQPNLFNDEDLLAGLDF
ncbi:T-kininogen 2-like [Pseudophryne corroboree]|uniref:T-kininogen 2-like n=1 Tax=Pseudophryne corroboree TaxID=495146 RepID=UPI003081CD09